MKNHNEQSRVLTLVFSDLADSTALKTARGDAAAHDLIVKHREHVARLAEESAGRIIDWAGDGCFLTFETSSAGVMFALRLQQVHAENPELPGVRIGIHMGEVSESPGPQGPDGPPRIDGLAVDLAARVSGLAKPGQVLMSSAVYNSARQRLGVDAFGQPIIWQAHGTYSLKGFDQPLDIGEAGLEGMAPLQAPEASEKASPIGPPQREPSKSRVQLPTGLLVFIAVALVLLVLRSFLDRAPDTSSPTAAPPPDSARPDSVAVMYFENLTDPADPDNLEATLASLLTFELSSSETLEVLPRQRLYDIGKQLGVGPDDDIDRSVATDIATRAGVASMIVGTIAQAGEQIRVSCELIEVATARLLHSFQASGTEDEIFLMAERLGGDLRDHLRHETDPTALTERLTNSVPAFKAYVLGETYLHEAKFFEADREFRQAIELDPDFAQAHFWRAITQSWLQQDEPIPMAQRAFELIDHFPPGYRTTVEASVRYFEGDWTEAFGLLNAALDTNPDNKEALYLLSEIYYHSHEIGDSAKSAEIMERILELDPDFDLVFGHLARCYIELDEEQKFKRLMQAGEEKELDIALEVRASWAAVHGDMEEAVRLLENAQRANASGALALLAMGMGRFDLAAEAHEKSKNDPAYPPRNLVWDRANMAAATGHFDEALLTYLETMPSWDRPPERVDGYDGGDLAGAGLRRAELFYLKGDLGRAQAEVKNVADVFGNSFWVLYWAGHYALENDDMESAEIYRVRLAELAEQARYPLYSNYVDVLEADIKLREQDYAGARDLLTGVPEKFERGGDPATVRVLLSRAYLGLGNPQEAADVLENINWAYWGEWGRVARIHSFFTLGKLKLLLGDPEAAREYFTRFLAHWGDADWDLDEVDEAKILLAELEQGTA